MSHCNRANCLGHTTHAHTHIRTYAPLSYNRTAVYRLLPLGAQPGARIGQRKGASVRVDDRVSVDRANPPPGPCDVLSHV